MTRILIPGSIILLALIGIYFWAMIKELQNRVDELEEEILWLRHDKL